jgi:hypothetical protein
MEIDDRLSVGLLDQKCHPDQRFASFEKKPLALSFRLGMPPGAWRPGLEPAELSFRVPHFFHQTRRGTRGTIIIYYAEFPGDQKIFRHGGEG